MRKLSSGFAALLLFLLLNTSNQCLAQLNIGAGATWVSTNDTHVVLNDMDLQYDAGPFPLNNIFRFTGTRSNTIKGNTQPVLYAISLAKTDPGGLSLAQSIRVTKRIHFATGLFDLNGHAITLDPTALLTNESETSRLIGPAGGYITIDANLSVAPTTVNPGNLGALITTATDLGTVNIARGHDLQHINDTSRSIARWYEISPPDNKTPNATLRFYYFSKEAEGHNPDSLALWQGYDATGWTNIGYTTRNATNKYVEKQGLTTLHRFTLHPSLNKGPVTSTPGLLLLSGNWKENSALLSWTVITEVNNDHFNIERKYASETSFTAIRTIPTKVPGGTSPNPTNYSYTDSTVSTGPADVAYRIHQVGIGGQSTYSNIITLKAIGGSTFIRKLFPTVAIGGQVYIQVGNKLLQKVQFIILDASGKKVTGGTLSYQSQWLPVGWLSHGIYRLVIRSGAEHFQTTFIR